MRISTALPVTGLRFFTVYGPWGRPDMALFLFTRNILAGKPIDVFNHGHHRRDFTYVDDIAEGVVRACDRVATAEPGLGRRRARSGHEPRAVPALQHRQQPAGRTDALHRGARGSASAARREKNLLPLQAGDVPDTWADIEDLQRDVGYTPATPVEVGIRRFVDWYLEYYGTDAARRTRRSSTSADRVSSRRPGAPGRRLDGGCR